MQVEEFSGENFHFSRTYLDIPRSDDFVVLQLTVSNTRTLAKKQALYREIVRNLAAKPGLRAEDVFINLVETLKENWSFGNGQAQYVRGCRAEAARTCRPHPSVCQLPLMARILASSRLVLISSAICAWNTSDVMGIGSMPCAVKRDFTLSASTAFVSSA